MYYTTQDVVEKYEARLNKSDSSDYDNLWWYQIEESYNKGVINVLRRIKRGKTQKQDPDESSIDRIDDLQGLIKAPLTLACSNKGLYSQTTKLPKDYLYYKRLSPKCTKGSCPDIHLKSYFREESMVDDLLSDFMTQPSYDFEQTFHTLSANRFKIYHNQDFEVKEAVLIYYALPRKVLFERGKIVDIEYKMDMVDLFIDEGIKIMSGDLESLSANQLSTQRTENNN